MLDTVNCPQDIPCVNDERVGGLRLQWLGEQEQILQQGMGGGGVSEGARVELLMGLFCSGNFLVLFFW